MKRRDVSLISRYALAVLLLGVVASLFVTWALAKRDFRLELAMRLAAAEKLVAAQSALPAQLYTRDLHRLDQHLREHLTDASVRYAAVFDGSGELLLRRHRDEQLAPDLARHSRLRAGVQPLETSIRERSLATPGFETRYRLLPRFFGDRVSDVSIPVVSPVNPMVEPVTAAAIIQSWSNSAAIRSFSVLGFVNAGISHGELWQRLRPGMLRTLLFCLLAVGAATALCWYYGRFLLGSLVELSKVAEEAASGRMNLVDVRFHARGEAKYIANLLNTAFAELKRYRANLNVDRELLSLKVAAQGTMLTERDQQLDEAKTEVSRSREDLHRMAYYDSLTGLPNRRLFTEQLTLLLRLCEREHQELALMFIDLDNFKRINDSLGHSAGDLLLREVGIRLGHCIRSSDLLGHFADHDLSVEISRLGGDEFTIIANNLSVPEEAGVVADRMLAALATPLHISGHELFITPSIGIAIGPRDGQDVEHLLNAADTAMYHAKASGKNNYVFYNDDMKTTDVIRLQLETDLRKALERDELLLYYQPMVSIETGTVVGLEALLRWRHPSRGLVSPGEFLPLAEEMGLMVHIGEWTLARACRMVAGLDLNGCSLQRVSVNISPLAVSRSFVDRVKTIVESTGAEVRYLELELTENVLMETDASSIESLQRLKELGVALSIDDFGTGYSSLSYLSHFPLDTLKIDRSFVMDFNKSQANRGLVEAIAAMAKSLDLSLVAEGVETSEQLKFLHCLKVDIIQGYWFSKPIPAEQLPHILEEGHFRQKTRSALLDDPPGLRMRPA